MSGILKRNGEMEQGEGTVPGYQVKDSGSLSSTMTEGSAGSVHQFKWNQQGSRLLEQLKALYNHPEGAGAVLGLQPDVALVSSDGGCVEAHRMVLSLCSAYFQELFLKVSQVTSPKLKDGPAVVVLGNVKTHQLQQLLQFLYTGEVAVSSDQLEEFLEIGNAFQIEEIMNFRSSTGNLSATQNDSSLTLNADDAKTNVLAGISEDDKESPVASSSKRSSILYEDVADEDMDISYDSYPIKVEGGSEEILDPLDESTDYHDEDPTWSGEDEDNQPSEMEDHEENDPTYEEKSVDERREMKRRRRVTRNLSIKEDYSKNLSKFNWQVQEPVSDDTLKLEWRFRRETLTTITYYCALGGRRCPAQLKKKTLNDGKVVWLNNQGAHKPHATPSPLWEVQDPVPDEILQLNWRILRTKLHESGAKLKYYYCATGGKQCPAKLKKKVLNDGTVVWLGNLKPHKFHPGMDSAKHKPPQCKPKSYKAVTLTPKQNQFVLKCLKGGVTTLNDILLKFKVQNLTPPEEQHLRAFLRNHQQTKKF